MQLQINSEKMELKSHGSYAFPVFISYERLSDYERGAFTWHWHPEIELTLILEGEMIYQVNDRVYHLREGQGLFCNTNALHTGHMAEENDCRYLSVTFHPRMIYGFENSLIQKEMVEPVLLSQAFASQALCGQTASEREILDGIREIERAANAGEFLYPLYVQEILLRIWRKLLEENEMHKAPKEPVSDARNVERIRKALDYLQSHYAERITLEQIAEQMNLCRSESCRFFKKYMKQSVFDYLQSYRIEKSISLLTQGDDSITEVALKSGFSSPAYFTKLFKQQMQCTPMNYRRRNRGLD
jgi:AraC-like DNA-binding protein/quercetin dioxygenase-like cupin family protein